MRAGIKKIILLAVIAGIVFGIYKFFIEEEPLEYGLTTSKITRGDIVSEVTATGELNALNVISVGTQVSGTVKEIYVDFNSVVKAGQLIALIDPALRELSLREAEANLSMYDAAVKRAQASLSDSEKKLARNKELYSKKLISKSTLDTAETDTQVKRAALREARARYLQGSSAVERAKTDLGYTRITSPVNGVVIDRQVDAGQTVASGYQTPTLFKIAEDLTKMHIETKIDEADIGTVKEGQSAKFRVDSFPDEEFSGEVVQVRMAASTSNSVVTYTVIINVSNPELKLKPGMTANVSIQTAEAKNVLKIPVAALRFTPPEELLETISYDKELLTEKKTLQTGILWPERDGIMMRPIKVEIGTSDGKFVELLKEESGSSRKILREGTELVINAQKGVKTGKKTSGGMRVGRDGSVRVPGAGGGRAGPR